MKGKSRKSMTSVVQTLLLNKEPGFTTDDLNSIWRGRFKFCRTALGLSKQKAKEWADGAVEAIKESERELQGGER